MNKSDIDSIAILFSAKSKDNYVSKEEALSEELIGLKLFEAPLLAVGEADDPLFLELKKDTGIGEHFLLPVEWMPQAKSVITFFFPFTEEVRISNRKDKEWPSEAWLHARIEGQRFINQFILHLQKEMQLNGYESVIPSLDKRFWAKTGCNSNTAHPEASFTSNWSERHVSFVCGLGTFGLSKGLITSKGMAGRLVSLITNLKLTSNIREYTNLYEYCINCGACIRKCPAGAISMEDGKNHSICSTFLDTTQRNYAPRYGCGKCQVGVPCENKIPM